MKYVRNWVKCLRHPLWLTAIILFVWYAVFGYKYGFIYNHGISMQPTIKNGEWIIMQKKSSMGKGWTPDRFDVVIIDDAKGERLSKRVVGLPGDTIEVKKGIIYVNEKKLEDPFGKGKILIYLVDENEKPLRYWETGEWGNGKTGKQDNITRDTGTQDNTRKHRIILRNPGNTASTREYWEYQ